MRSAVTRAAILGAAVVFTTLSFGSTGSCATLTGGTPPDAALAAGEPLGNLPSGIFVASKTDFYIAGPLPLVLTRTYRTRDVTNGTFNPRDFGVGVSFNYGIFLYAPNEGGGDCRTVDVILPDGARVQCSRSQSSCTDTTDAFECSVTPYHPFSGATITYNSNTPGWDLTLTNGTVYSFGDGAPLQSIHDRYGNQITIDRGQGVQRGPIQKIESSSGRSLSFTYDATHTVVTQVKDDLNRLVQYQYDSNNRLTQYTDATNATTKFTYVNNTTQLGDLASATDALGNKGTGTYDSSFRVTKLTGTLGSVSYAYNTSGGNTVVTVTDADSVNHKLTFNPAGYLISRDDAPAQTYAQPTTYTRDAATNLITSILDPLTRTTNFGYDGVGDVTSITYAAGSPQAVTYQYAYGPFDQLRSVTDPLNHATMAHFDSDNGVGSCGPNGVIIGNVCSVSDPAGNATTFTYNAQGQPLSVTDPTGNTTNYAYDPANSDLTSITDPLGNVTAFTYDTAGHLTAVTDPLREVYSFSYDDDDRLTQTSDPNLAQTSFLYDSDGNLTTVTDAKQHSTTYAYNFSLGEVTRCDASNHCEHFIYDGNGNLVQFVDARGLTTDYTLDNLNRVTKIQYNAGGNSNFAKSSITYSYDQGNRVTKAVDSVAGTINRTGCYDLLDRLTCETTPQGTVTYTYDNAGRRTSMTAGSQAQVTYGYDDPDSRLQTVSQGTANVTMGYDAAGRRTSLALPNGVTLTYGYDGDSRLTSISAGSLGNLTYSYDAVGRVTQVGGSAARIELPLPTSQNATYAADNRITGWNGHSCTSNANDDLTADGLGDTYTWDERNHLSQAVTSSLAVKPTYDAFGRRQKFLDYASNSYTVSFLYDGLNPVHEQNTNGNNADLLTGLGLDEVFTRTDNSGTMSFLRDKLNSTVALTDSSGTDQDDYNYGPFGDTNGGGSNASPYQWTGRENDPSGLYYMRTRDYHPTLQRFLSPDPLGFGGGDVNLFRYAGNSPTNFSDPLGLQSLGSIGATGGGGGKGWYHYPKPGPNGPGTGPGDSPGGTATIDGLTVQLGGGSTVTNGYVSGIYFDGWYEVSPGWSFSTEVTVASLGYFSNGLGGGVTLAQSTGGGGRGGTFNPGIFYNCIHEHLLTGRAAPVAPACVAGGVIGGLTGNPAAVALGYATCTYGILVEAYCTSKARGGNPPEPPEPPELSKPGVP
jgi:RHS repeat-associated protein